MKHQAAPRLFMLLTIVFLIVGCLPTAGEVTPTASSPPVSATAEIDPTQTVEPDAPSIPVEPLSGFGPWLVFTASDGIYAINPDASGLTQLLSIQLNERYRSTLIASTHDGLIAFLSQGDRDYDVNLTIFSIPDRAVVKTIDLTSAVPSQGDDAMRREEVEAIVYHDAIAFSPDGSKLAFIGVLDGPSSDLYVYDIAGDSITRLTDGPSQGFDPHWSPNGIYIVHFGVDSFGTGAGYSMAGAWAARADDSDVISLYDPSDQGAEQFIGWVDDTTFLVNSWNPGCGSNNLRTFDIETFNVQVLWADAFDDIVYDEANGTLAVAVANDWASCNPTGRLGVFLVPLDGTPSQQVLSGEIRFLAHDVHAFDIIAMEDVMMPVEILPDGSTMSLNASPTAYGYPVLSPDGLWAAWPGRDFWIGPRDPQAQPELVLAEDIVKVVWSPASSAGYAVVMIGRDALYVANAPEFIPLPVLENVDVEGAIAIWAYR
jgi:hypothetical protein